MKFYINWLIFIYISLTNTVYAHCDDQKECTYGWVAAQDIGIGQSWFSQASAERIGVDKIEEGNWLVSQGNINIRKKPDVSSQLNSTLLKESIVYVKDTKLVIDKDGEKRLFLKIRVDKRNLTSSNNSVTKNNDPNITELDTLDIRAKKVINCFSKLSSNDSPELPTISNVYECSGYWVTPRALMLCALGNGAICPVLPDTIEGRGILTSQILAEALEHAELKIIGNGEDDYQYLNTNGVLVSNKNNILQIKVTGVSGDVLFENSEYEMIHGDHLKEFKSLLNTFEGNSNLSGQQKKKLIEIIPLIAGRVGFNLNIPLEIDPETIPKLPNINEIQNCKKNASSSDIEFKSCVTAPLTKNYSNMLSCFGKITEGEKLACLASQSKNEDFTNLIGCLGGGIPSADKLASCASNKEVKQDYSNKRNCILNSTNDTNSLSCITDNLPENQKKTVNCLLSPSGASNPTDCLDQISPNIKEVHTIYNCLNNEENDDIIIDCLSSHVNQDQEEILSCLTANGDRIEQVQCLLPNNPAVSNVLKINKCLKVGSDGQRSVSSMLANCTDTILDEQSRQTLSCLVEAKNSGNSRSKLVNCAASAALPQEYARIVGCASSSQGPTSFALCAVNPYMNEEARIALECAAESGGEPVTFTSCTAGRLTINELTKCLNGQIGKDCFGPNNSIVVALNNAFHDLTMGPGKNNEIISAIDKVKDLTGGPNSVINNPSQILGGQNSIFNNPGQILGGENSVFHNPGQVVDPSQWRF
jgi:hypothetical protein